MHVFYLGAPGAMGGANTEMGHTIAVWRQHGIAVTVIPTWAIDAATRRQVEAIGCKLVAIAGPEHLNQVPGLPGAIVHSMCNSQLWRAYPALRAMRCRVIWSNCMTFMFPEEPAAIRACGPCDAYHFQSAFQKEELERQLIPLGYNHGMGHLIPGAFDFTAIPHHPCAPHAGLHLHHRPAGPPGRRQMEFQSLADPGPRPLRPPPRPGDGLGAAPRPQVRGDARMGGNAGPAEDPRYGLPRPLPRHGRIERRRAGELAADWPRSDGRRRAAGLPERLGLEGDDRRTSAPASSPIATRKWPSALPNSPTTRIYDRRSSPLAAPMSRTWPTRSASAGSGGNSSQAWGHEPPRLAP